MAGGECWLVKYCEKVIYYPYEGDLLPLTEKVIYYPYEGDLLPLTMNEDIAISI